MKKYGYTLGEEKYGLKCGSGVGAACSELSQARSKKLELGWLGSDRRQSQNLSLARLRLKLVSNFQDELGFGSKIWKFTS